ncbi:hypothetical protein C8J56DRAFT_93480 [Mycena floridula]|nr:hypothetical protein C8J56DRAFT_93480 [Mycena floridula]
MPTVQQPQKEYTSFQPLRPTFSMNIIRTPEHYATRRHSSVASSSNPSRNLSALSSIDSLIARRMSQLSVNQNESVFVDEPSSMLSPLIMNTPKLPANNRLGRPTIGTGLSTIPLSHIDSSRDQETIFDESAFVNEPSSMLSPLMMTTPKPLADTRLGRPTIGTGLSAIHSRSSSHDPSRDRDRERERRVRFANLESASYGVPAAGGPFNGYPAPSSAPAFNRTSSQERSRTPPQSYQHLTTASNGHHNSHRTPPNFVNGHGPMPPEQYALATSLFW